MFGVKLKAVQKYSVEQIDFELGKLSSQIMNADFKIVELEEALLLANKYVKEDAQITIIPDGISVIVR